MRKTFLTLATLTALAVSSASAAPISGELFITGSVNVDMTSADFFPPMGGDLGVFNVEPASTGFFAPLSDTDGEITDLDIATAPPGVGINIPFLNFVGAPGVIFQLRMIDLGTFPPCLATPNCSIGQFNLTQAGTSVVANFNVSGDVLENGALVSTFTGAFSQVFTSTTIAAILGQVAQPGGLNSAYDGNFIVTPIPEPGTGTLLAVAGVLLLSRLGLRRRTR